MAKKSSSMTRRAFLGATSGAGIAAFAAPYLIPSGVLAAPGRTGANDRIGVGYIGTGRRGRQIMGLPEGAQIVAVSDLNLARMEDLKAKNPSWKTYQYYRDLLADPDVDAVVIATPDHWHALPSIDACKAGKDVYVEKPMTLTIREGQAMVKAARENKRIVQVGSQQRSDKEFRLACELIRNGRAGKIHTVHTSNYPSPWDCPLGSQEVPEGLDWDMWCGQTTPRPYHEELYLPRVRGQEAGWISFTPYSGGEMTGWGAHGFDIIQWALGTEMSGPVEVWPVLDTKHPDESYKGPSCQVVMKYANGTEVRLDMDAEIGGGLFVGDAGEIYVDRGKLRSTPEDIVKEPLGESEVRLYQSDNHMQNWIDCIRSRELPIADVEIGHRSTTVCHLGNIVRWAGRKLQWDPVTERFVNDDDANAFIERPMREPYAIDYSA